MLLLQGQKLRKTRLPSRVSAPLHYQATGLQTGNVRRANGLHTAVQNGNWVGLAWGNNQLLLKGFLSHVDITNYFPEQT